MEAPIPTLSMMWALEKSDLMQLTGDVLDMPEFVPTLLPTFKSRPKNEKTSQAPWRRPSLANLRHQQAIRTTRHLGQPKHSIHFSAEIGVDHKKKMWNGDARRSAGKHLETISATTEANGVCWSSKDKQNGATGVVQDSKFNSGTPLKQFEGMSNNFLAGAAVLGLRRKRNGSTSETPVHPSALPVSNDVKDQVHAARKFVVAKLLKEAAKVPHAPGAPPPENARKHRPIRGVPVLVISTNQAEDFERA